MCPGFTSFFFLKLINYFSPCSAACRILDPWPGIEPRPQQWKHQVPIPGPPGNFPSGISAQSTQVSISVCFHNHTSDTLCFWTSKHLQGGDQWGSGGPRRLAGSLPLLHRRAWGFHRPAFRVKSPEKGVSVCLALFQVSASHGCSSFWNFLKEDNVYLHLLSSEYTRCFD